MNSTLDLSRHPCFNSKSAGCSGRIHLPVAPRCNVQCNYCNRQYDCANETRPGVTSRVLKPAQALAYLDHVMSRNTDLAVVGIAGPGDPFANPEQTMETLRLVRGKYPEMLLCVSTNGLGIGPYLDELKELNVSHVTITMNTTRLKTAERIYAWLRIDKRLRNAREGVPILLERQLAAMRGVKERGMVLKVNCILLPGVNDDDVEAVAAAAKEAGADLLNILPYYPTQGCKFENVPEPAAETMSDLRKKAGTYLPQMTHCARCRADAVGLLGKDQSADFREAMEKACAEEESPLIPEPVSEDPARPYVAVATREGMLVNQHLGEALTLSIYRYSPTGVELVERRQTPPPGGGNRRWLSMARMLHDCRALVVSNLGDTPKRVLSASGVRVLTAEGVVDDIVERICTYRPMNHLVSRNGGCATCTGAGKGCG